MVGTGRRNQDPAGRHPDNTNAVLGVVTRVWSRVSTDDSSTDITDSSGTTTVDDEISNHEANVLLQSNAEHLRRVPIHTEFADQARVPQVDDFVRVEFGAGTSSDPMITGFANTTEDRAPLARPGHWRYRFDTDGDPLFVEAERSDHGVVDEDGGSPYDVVRLAKKPDGLSDPTTEVAIDDSGNTTQVRIETDGDITISAGGNVVIDEGGTTKSVLTEDAVFEYEQRVDTSDGTGGTTTQTTTTVSNSETTQTQIE